MNNSRGSGHLDWVDPTRVVAALAVVLLHIAAEVVTADTLEPNQLTWWLGNVADSATRWCVPVFVMLSGALLLAPSADAGHWMSFYQKRLRRLGLPILFWTLLFLGRDALRWPQPDWNGMLQRTLTGYPYYHLWYLYMIPGLYLLTPALQILVRHISLRQLGWLCLGLLGCAILNELYNRWHPAPPRLFITLSLPYIGYFLAGHWLNSLPQQKWPWPVLLGSIALTAGGCGLLSQIEEDIQIGTYFYDFFSITTVPMGLAAFALCRHLPTHRALTFLAPLSLGIYILHPLIIELLANQGLRTMRFPVALGIPLLTLLAFAGAALISWAILRIPGLRRVL